MENPLILTKNTIRLRKIDWWLNNEIQKIASAKEAEIQTLKAKLESGDVAQKLAVAEALSAVEKQRDLLANQLAQAKQETESSTQLIEIKFKSEIQELQTKLSSSEVSQQLAIVQALGHDLVDDRGVNGNEIALRIEPGCFDASNAIFWRFIGHEMSRKFPGNELCCLGPCGKCP